MDKLVDQLFLQMVIDTIRVVMVIFAFGILIYIGKAINCFSEFLADLIVKGCKAIWRFIKKLFTRPEILVATAEKDEEA